MSVAELVATIIYLSRFNITQDLSANLVFNSGFFHPQPNL